MPSRKAQEDLIQITYDKAGLDLLQTAYFEAHGTGTPAGDPIEAGAIATVLGSRRNASNPLLVGSIKSNIGYLESVAGLAGLIKAVLILEKGFIPPSINFEKPREDVALEQWNLKVR